jgi:signal transduction histidine kinase
LVLLDVQMPTMDGFETASKMNRFLAERGRGVPIVFVTGIDISPAHILEAYAAGGVDVIEKPIIPEVLRRKASVFVELYRARSDERRRLQALTTLARELSPARTRSEVAAVIVDHGMRFAQADISTLHVLNEATGALELIGERGVAPEVVERIRRMTDSSEHAENFASLRAGAAAWAEDDADYQRIYPALATIKAEARRARAFWRMPLVVESRPIGLLGMGFYEPRRFSAEDRAFVEAFGMLCAQALLRALRLEREERDHVRTVFLAKAGEALVSSLDYSATLKTVAQLAVPQLADWCSIELLDPDAPESRQAAVAHVDPEKVESARQLSERYPPDRSASTGVPQVIRSGKSELYTEIPAALLEAAARDAEHLRLIRELRLESAIVVPLRTPRRILGAMSFIYAESGRHYTENDLAFAEDFARRSAMAIENSVALRESEEARALERRLRAESEANGRFQEVFLAILGHDLRNPLGSIDMAAAMLRKSADDRTRRLLDRMMASSQRMTRMIEQILDLTRSRIGGGLEIQRQPGDLTEILSQVVDELRALYPSRLLEFRCPPSLQGSWDRDRLAQVFSNLVGNAIQYGVATNPVTIEAIGDDSSVAIRIHNDGPSIPEELRSKLFDPFRRGYRDSRSTHTEGLGLGLFISHEVIVAHGGSIDVQSGAATGTTFRVLLPRNPPDLRSS